MKSIDQIMNEVSCNGAKEWTDERLKEGFDKLMEEDYPESEIIVTSKNTRVAIRSFSNLISAVNYMEQIRNEDPRFADAWVMKSE